MAAVVRGGSPDRRARTSAAPRVIKAKPRSKPKSRTKAKPYRPAKLEAARSLGLMPLTALTLAGAVVAGGVLAIMASDPRVERAREQAIASIDQGLIDVGFRVSAVTVQGATPDAAAAVVRAAALPKDQPILHLDLAALRARVEQVGWVKSAKVVRLLPNTILISITQRQTLAIWQHAGRTLVIDADGRAVPEADPGRFPDLPLVVGEGADKAAPQLLPLLRARPRLMDKLDAVVRVDDRRWDLRLKDASLIALPASGEAVALTELDRLDAQSHILDLGFARIDLRDPELVSVRPRDAENSRAQAATNGA
ncbi:MAG TPA: cell division protein FtsQ/DivIB [Caulobacteraceae bacterium]|nr:cell division protein FtsQ/DivIB [Caulobacteraceae bacterium]